MMQATVWSSSASSVPLQPSKDESLFVFGYGYTAVQLGNHLRTKGWKISGTCRSLEKKRLLEENYGVEAYVFGPSVPLDNTGSQALRRATHLFSCVPPDPETLADPVLDMHIKDIRDATQEQCPLRWIGYVSSTGVYGDHLGGWVDESTQPKPAGKKALARLAAENSWLNLQQSQASVQIFRAGGIYGPGRSVLEALQGSRQPRASEARELRRFTSRIHVSDICQVLMASMESPNSGRIYNLVDDDPASRSEVVAFARNLLGMTNLPAEESGDRRANFAEKRVMNKRIKEELGVKLMYPSYREGLAALVRLDG